MIACDAVCTACRWQGGLRRENGNPWSRATEAAAVIRMPCCGQGSRARWPAWRMLLELHGPCAQPEQRCLHQAALCRRVSGRAGPIRQPRCAPQLCRQPGNTLTDLETEQPSGLGFNGGPSPSAVFETARMQVPIFQSIQEREQQQNTDSISVEHIPGFASVGSNVYEVRLAIVLITHRACFYTLWACQSDACTSLHAD